jgi:membrane protein DedA with SNARE-associated domain
MGMNRKITGNFVLITGLAGLVISAILILSSSFSNTFEDHTLEFIIGLWGVPVFLVLITAGGVWSLLSRRKKKHGS